MNAARDLIDGMGAAEFDRLVLHLGRYALQAARLYRWRTGGARDLPGGHTVESVVLLAVEKAWLGERRWDAGRQPDFRKYLMDVVDSLLYHLATGKDNELLTPEPAPGTAAARDWHAGSDGRDPSADWLARRAPTPEEELLGREARDDAGRALALLFEEARGDDELTRVIRATLEGRERPGEIAEVTGISVRDVYNVMKRLNRKLAAVGRRLREGEGAGRR